LVFQKSYDTFFALQNNVLMFKISSFIVGFGL